MRLDEDAGKLVRVSEIPPTKFKLSLQLGCKQSTAMAMNWGLPSWLGFMKRLGPGAGCHRCHSHTESLSPCTSLMR